ncbi:hypothetical protein [Caldimonas taiwanensis]|uniref:hypothetical protein n=1 Tax=Caldimonas taiwanensis TaxID=307483 RepID=UPI0007839792|nr:hypothetical protein [Caldimonas taiwanensis]
MALADSPPGEPASPMVDIASSARQSLRASAEWLARGVDGWFGDHPFEDGGSVSDGVFQVRLLLRQQHAPRLGARFNASFRLPNIEQRSARLFVGRDDARDLVTDQPQPLSREQRLQPPGSGQETFFAGLGVHAGAGFDARLGLRGGIKPYAQLRYRHQWELGPADRLHLRETVFWTRDDRVGSTTAVSYEHEVNPTLIGRWLHAATYTQRSQRVEWSSNLGLYQFFGNQRLLSTEALFRGREGGGVKVEEYGLQLSWEQALHEDWLLGQVSLGHFRERETAAEARRGLWALGLTLTIRF